MFSKWFSSATFRQYAVVIIVNLNLLSTGLFLGWTSPVLLKLRDGFNPVLSRPITEKEGSWIVSIVFMGSIIETAIAMYFYTKRIASVVILSVIDRIGRKLTILVGVIPRIIASFLLVFSKDVSLVIIAQLLSGVSLGFMYGAVPVYSTEIASNKIRGGLGVLLTIFMTVGIVIMLCIGPFLNYFALNIILLCTTVAAGIPLIFLPDTPYILFKKGNKEACLKTLTFLRASKVVAEKEILEYESRNDDKKIDFKDIFQSKIFLKTVFFVVFLGMGTQIVGNIAVQSYLQTILEASHTNIPSEIASVVIGIVQLFTCIFAACITDRYGRKPIFIVSLIGEAVGLVALGTYFYLLETGANISGVWNAVPLVSLIIVMGFYNGGLGCLLTLLYSEMFEGRSRPVGVFCALLSTKIFGFLMTRYISSMINTLGAGYTYWIFAFNCVIVCLFIVIFIPETKGRSIDEIQVKLGKK